MRGFAASRKLLHGVSAKPFAEIQNGELRVSAKPRVSLLRASLRGLRENSFAPNIREAAENLASRFAPLRGKVLLCEAPSPRGKAALGGRGQ